MSWRYLSMDLDGRVATITLDIEHKMNALEDDACRDLFEAIQYAGKMDEVNAIILTGKGKSFCAGSDIQEMINQGPEYFRIHSLLGHKVVSAIRDSEKIVVAAVNGYAMGGGMEISLACDLRFASEKAVFGLPEINLNVSGGWGGAFTLPRLIGLSRAKDLLLTGRTINAQEAYDFGLVNRVYAENDFRSSVKREVEVFAGKGQKALALMKFLSNRGLEVGLDSHAWLESISNAYCSILPEFQQGILKYKK